ncbi:MAG TPA: class I SAM-dependent methyltransferase [Candidatus Eisenbacteria bacterium]|nr:class I SAM-dependent methyltransferase [Candidatus Eisenbacteria bacterium]
MADFLRRALARMGLLAPLSVMRRGPLKDDGWIRSLAEGAPVDAAGNPIPWLTYPAIELLQRRVRPEMSVFEYGCGHSTLWWAARVRDVVSCEHDQAWLERIRSRAPANVTLRHVALEYDGAYSRTVAEYPGRFDVVVIDGRDRVNCARHAVTALAPGGVIVWDNSDRAEYRPGFDQLGQVGFRRLELVGLYPTLNEKGETSILYRDRNVFGL